MAAVRLNPVQSLQATFTPAILSNKVDLNPRLKVTRFFLFFFLIKFQNEGYLECHFQNPAVTLMCNAA